MHKSKLGRFYGKGKKLETSIRYEIIDKYGEGKSVESIATELKLDPRTVLKTVREYMDTGHVECSGRTTGAPTVVANETVVQTIEYYLFRKPSLYLKEIQDMLVKDGVCQVDNVPCISYIQKIIKNRLGFSRKKLTVKAKEGLTDGAQNKFDIFLNNIEGINPMKIHWFDESSVVMTTGNRHFGYAAIGKRAFEIQKYASNANYTVNLLQSPLGVDYYNIVDGPSNGLHLIDFFIHAVNEQDVYGNNKLSYGDIVIMDNCAFHHGHLAETYLTNILQQRNISLVFQPPYNPELNTCEKSFSKMKYFLRSHTKYTERFPQLAICDAISEISQTDCFNYARHCGYFV